MMEETCDVVIVGAGLAGLNAAFCLRKRNPNMKIVILEGKGRVGGRTVTEDVPAVNGVDRWDFGGQWVSSSQTHVMELIQELGLEVYPQYTTGKKVYDLGGPGARVRTYSTSIPTHSPLTLMDHIQLLWRIDRLCATVSVEDPYKTPNAHELDSMTLHSYVEQHAWTRELKDQMGVASRAVFGVEPSQMSLLYFLMYAAAAGGILPLLESTPGSAQEYRVKGGTQQLSERLAELVGRESVRLGQAVMSIWQDDKCVRVGSAAASFRCRAVIVTAPPHLAAKIQYQPALPSQRERLTQSMSTGHLIKFIITYQTAFWREKGLSGEILARPTEDCPLSVTFDATSPAGSPALVGFLAGMQASRWGPRQAGERREAVVASLVRYLGSEAASYIHYQEKDWALEEFSGGCPVSVMTTGALTYYHPSLRTPYGRVHWAGTETATRWCGYMSGALQSGQRAALEVLAELCPSALSPEELEAVREAVREARSESSSQQPSASSSRSPLPRALLLVGALTVGAALLLAQPQLCRHWIGQARGVLNRVLLRL